MRRLACIAAAVVALLLPAIDAGAATAEHDGVWRVVPAESFVGYRVRERLAMLPAPSDAVGRTSAISGSATVSGGRIVETRVATDLRTLKSDSDRRDQAVVWRLDKRPRASFALTAPITLPDAAVDERFSVSARARLSIHGVTRTVAFPLQVRWTADRLQVIGSLRVRFSDYDIGSVRVGPVISVGDTAKIEVQLSFERG